MNEKEHTARLKVWLVLRDDEAAAKKLGMRVSSFRSWRRLRGIAGARSQGRPLKKLKPGAKK